ncbi:MAG: hypothetical protein K0R17_395 [Rariglobus sp.]|nr:hypothetical protein [Rariglobus sp.]
MLITITLLAFLVLLLVSLASLTRVETQVASNNQHIAQARQNALMALNLALGQLQKHAGPDQRVTARADVQPAATAPAPSPYPSVDPASGTNLTANTATALGSIDTYWRNRRNRQWTGVWRNRNTPDYTPPAPAFDSNNPAAYNPVPALQSWLVSGNENGAATFSPSTAVTGLTITSTPVDRIADANGAFHRLLVKASAGVTAATDLDRAVTAPEIEIRSSATPGNGTTDTLIGHYAWWVGDEGIKARANLVDPHASAGTAEANLTRLQSAQRPAIEAMTTNGTDGLAPLAPPTVQTQLAAYQASLLNIQSSAQFPFITAAAPLSAELKSRYHDLSVSSRGLLADVKNGGLKTDLSYLFGLSNLTDFRTALRALYGTNSIAPLNPNPAVSTDLANPLLNPVATLRATFPTTAADGGNYAAATQFANTSTWEQLWSFANQGSTFNAAGQAAPRVQTATQHGLYPLIIQTKMFYRLRIEGGSTTTDPDGTVVNRTGAIYVDVLPLFVLANPYAVPLAASDYQVRVSGSNPALVFGKIDPAATTPPSPTNDFTPAYSVYNPTWAGNRTFVLRTTGMAAGEAQIFTIDPDPALNTTIDADDRILVARQSGNSVPQMDNKRVYMKNEFDPAPALTYLAASQTSPYPPITIPSDKTHAALRIGTSGLITILFQGFTPGDAQGYLKLLQFTTAQNLTGDAEFGGATTMFVVDPMSDGIRQGGGVNSIVNQPPTTDHRAAKPPSGSVFFSHQQAPFLQVNYRTNQIMWTGSPSNPHPLEWARRFTKNGSTGSAGNTPNPWFGANLMRPSGSTTTVRWGLVNIGEGQNQTVPPASIGGPSALDVGFNNYLYDIPRAGHPLASLGQLQHFNTTGYHPIASTPNQVTSLSSWQTNYSFSNSYPQPRVPRDQLFNYVNNGNISLHYHFDGSSIWNDLFWDRFTFSTYPQSAAVSFDFATDKLINARYRPFRDRTTVPWDDETKFRGDGNPATAANTRAAAANLLVDGAFNINSTSIEAWKAVFSSLKNVPAGSETTPSAPFPRTLSPTAGSAAAATGTSPDSWAGFRNLSTAEVQSLAEEMVMQVRKRGPFLSLSDFVNRRLIKTADDTLGLGLSGALQAALDRAVNQTSRLTPAFNVKSSAVSATSATNPNLIAFSEIGYILPAALAGFPGYMLQGDVLSALGPSLSARSDTFTIRTYGDATNPATGEVTGRAWCEAVVQRLPDYVDPAADVATATPAAGTPNATFGRRFQIISFRWLSPEDV